MVKFERQSIIEQELTKQQAFELLQEAVNMMVTEKGGKPAPISTVKIRMKLLNATFDERKLGFRSWKSFVSNAVKQSHVRYAGIDEANLMLDGEAAAKLIPEVFSALLKVLPAPGPNEETGWVRFDEVAKKLPYRKLGYNQFKKLALDAEKRGFVLVRNSGSNWQIKKNQG